MVKRLRDINIFYGWFIVAAGFVVTAASMGIAYNTFSIFIDSISSDLGFTRQQMNGTVSIRFLTQMIVAFFSGKIFARYNLKALMKVSSLALPISFILYSFSNSLYTYYIITIIMSVSVILLTFLPFSIIINNWFYERSGFATGIVFMGTGVGGMIFSSLGGIWLTNYGWRVTYQIFAVIMFLLIVPCIFFIIYCDPKDLKLSPFGKTDGDSESDGEVEGVLLVDARKTLQFWLIGLSSIAASMANTTLVGNVAPHLTDIGYSTRFSANITALTMGSMAIFKMGVGQIFDKFGLRVTITISYIATLIGLIGLVYSNYYSVLFIVIICVGLGGAIGSMGSPLITQDIFGKRDYSAIYGVFMAVGSIGGISGPLVIGYVFDQTGSYNLAFKIMAGLSLGVLIVYQYIFAKPIEEDLS